MKPNTTSDALFRFFLTNREQTITVFKVISVALLIVLYFAIRSVYYIDDNFSFFYSYGIKIGQIAILLYVVTLIPGMTKRFGMKHKLLSLLMIFRRYFGIAMFICVLSHYWIVRGVDIWLRGIFVFPPPLFELAGFLSFVLLVPMVITSHDWAVKLLGIWWWRIHKLTYVIMFLIFLHVALQRWSNWSLLMAIVLFGQISSYVFSLLQKRSIITTS